MKCPYCGTEMAAGMLHQMDEVYWTLKEKPREKGFLKSLLASFNSVRLIEYKTSEGWVSYPLEVHGRHCPNCNIFLFRGRLERDENTIK